MKERLKKELKVALIIFLFLTITYIVFYFIDIIKEPSITGMIVYTIETNYKNYTFTNASLYSFNDTFINLSNGIRLKGTYTYYNITNETNQTITLINITYPDSGIIDTLDFSPSDLNSWDELTKNEDLNYQNTSYYYSTDSQNYTLIDFLNNSNDFNLSDINSTKIMFRINLISNTTETPVVNYLTLKYLVNVVCVEDWQCGDWSECYENNTKIRSCTDNNACGSEDDKPDLVMDCDYPVCEPNWTALYDGCLINDTELKYYNDTSKCDNITTIPSDNNTYVNCDYCLPNWTCSEYGNCTGNEKTCLTVIDENDCYSTTSLASDNYTGDYSEFVIECNVTNETTTETSASEGEGGEETPAGEAAPKVKLESKCNYDISVNIPNLISFIEENNYKTNIKNKGCKIDKLSLSLSDEFKDIAKLSEFEIVNLEKDKTSLLNLSTNPLLTRIKPKLLIQGFATKIIERQTKNITGNLIIKGTAEDEVKIDKSILITMEVILFDKIKLEHKSPIFVIILLGLLIAITIVYLTTRFRFKFKVD